MRLLALAIPLVAACSISPLNGQTVTTSLVGTSFGFQGFVNEPNQLISIQVLKTPDLDTSLDTSWTQIGTTKSSTTPLYNSDPNGPLYQWAVQEVPLPTASSRWQEGGVLQTRTVSTDSAGKTRVLTTFDQVTFAACESALSGSGASWYTIGTQCAGIGNGVATMVSTSKVVNDLPTKPDWLGYYPDAFTTVANTEAYYGNWHAPQTLADFQSHYNYDPFQTNELSAYYYNDNDLGLGRAMHCKLQPNQDVACYVTNFSGVADQAVFGNDPITVMHDVEVSVHSFATVAMVFTKATGEVNFVAYNSSGGRLDNAQLDSTGRHTTIPNNCLTCHGVGAHFDNASNTISPGPAKFLPFDVPQLKYDTKYPFTRADAEESLRKLNALVLQTNPTPATADFVNGMYAATGGVNHTGAVASDTYVPTGWIENTTQSGPSAYLGIVKVGCRMCHMSALDSKLDFLQSDDFGEYTDAQNHTIDQVANIRKLVCGPAHAMPQAERTAFKFWKSGARGLLVTGFPRPGDGYGACKP